MMIYIRVRNFKNILLNNNNVLNVDYLDDTMFSTKEVANILAKREDIKEKHLVMT